MPLKRCQTDDKPGWKWGDEGKCYPYTAGDEASEKAARKKAMAQAAAMGEFEGTGDRARMAVEVEHRNSTLQDVDKRQRLIELIAVPWEQETDVFWRDDMWHESFDRHAFDGLENHAGRVQVNREHVKGDTVGRVTQFDPTHPEGLFARVKIADTPRGHETLALAEEGMAFPSVGFRVPSFADMRVDKRSRTRKILKARMDHLAMVEDPAYVGAEVLAVRAGQSGLTVVEQAALPETPALDELAHDPLFEWAAARLRSRD